MDQFSDAELVEFLYTSIGIADTQFQYWLTITFSVVVAAFVAGNKLNRPFRYVAALLYVLASVLLISRFNAVSAGIAQWLEALDEAGVELASPSPGYVILFRVIVLLAGTGAALFYLLKSHQK